MIRQLMMLTGAARIRGYLLTLGAFAIVQGLAFVLIVPVLRALFAGDPAAAWPWLGGLALAVLVCGVLQYRQAVLGFSVGLDLSRSLYHQLGDHLSALPLGWFQADRVGRIGRLVVQGVRAVMGVPAHLLQPLVTAYLTPATVVVASLFPDWRLGLALAVGGLVLAGTHRYTAGLMERVDHSVDAASAEAGSRVVEFAQAQAVLRGFGRTGPAYTELESALLQQYRAGRRSVTSAIPGLGLNALAVQVLYTALIALGTYLTLGGSLDPAGLIVLLALATRFTEPLLLAAELGGALRMGRNNLARFAEILATPTLPEPAEPVRQPPPGAPAIQLDHVDFGYDDTLVLHDLSLTVPPRTMTALVGPSGSGKTTVTRLIARFFDVQSGAVRVDGHDVRELGTEDLMSRLSLVFQDVYLFDDTIEENIRLGRPGATDEEVRRAAALARVDTIVDRLPDGWATRVGESGAALSGGERQRVSIARAILKDAPIVLLDEATAALDSDNEAAVIEALHALTEDRTLLVIAHRLATVRAADQIVVLDGGRVAETGDHDRLLAAGGRYAAFWRERTRAAGWRLISREDGRHDHAASEPSSGTTSQLQS
ncbi:ABC transporter ATP-binding protein [Acrocarpospora macrocephala]|uniref:ABC transporter n=1 Tax=Acrocarpospora macrocephala TaxID=150177 RepID=A0A5M3X6T2_9ACTN|nr:ABC transporter ATP-binding protein [Acrocarpospora macrocephala]GES16372.1 ABC transporter [Acrocarpospora macrocephala]